MAEQPEIDPKKQREAREYAARQRLLWLANMAVSAVYILVLLFGGASSALAAYAQSVNSDPMAVVGIYFGVFFAVYLVITLPFDIYGGLVLPHRYGLSNQNLLSWTSDWFKSNAIGLVMGLVGVEVLYLLLQFYPEWWWVPAAIGLILFSVLLTNLAPILLVPIFYKLKPLDNEGLRQRLVELAQRARTKVRGVYVMNMSAKTNAANAALMGLANTRRMVLGDTLLDKFASDEIEAVMAHELGHHVHRDIPKLIAVESISIVVSLVVVNAALHWSVAVLGFGSVDNIAAFPILVIAAAVVGFIAMPLSNGFSRLVERQADEYAMSITGNPPYYAKDRPGPAGQHHRRPQPQAADGQIAQHYCRRQNHQADDRA
jgi:STE24 endopeptidase